MAFIFNHKARALLSYPEVPQTVAQKRHFTHSQFPRTQVICSSLVCASAVSELAKIVYYNL